MTSKVQSEAVCQQFALQTCPTGWLFLLIIHCSPCGVTQSHSAADTPLLTQAPFCPEYHYSHGPWQTPEETHCLCVHMCTHCNKYTSAGFHNPDPAHFHVFPAPKSSTNEQVWTRPNWASYRKVGHKGNRLVLSKLWFLNAFHFFMSIWRKK